MIKKANPILYSKKNKLTQLLESLSRKQFLKQFHRFNQTKKKFKNKKNHFFSMQQFL